MNETAFAARTIRFLLACALCWSCASPGAPDSAARMARERLAEHRQAMEAYQAAAVDGEADAAAAHDRRATALLDEALALFEQAGAGEADDPELLTAYAQALFLRGDVDLSVEVRRRLVERRPESADAWFALGGSLAATGEKHYPEAIDAFRRGVALAGETEKVSQPLVVMGRLYWEEGLYDLARETFDRSLAVDPENRMAALMRALLDVREGQVKAAADILDQYGMPPADAMDLLARALRDMVARREWFEDTAANHEAYAKLLFRANRLGESLAPLERALQLQPDAYTAWNLLGSINRQMGNTARAREAFRRSLEVNPDQPRTREVLRELAPEEDEKDSDEDDAAENMAGPAGEG